MLRKIFNNIANRVRKLAGRPTVHHVPSPKPYSSSTKPVLSRYRSMLGKNAQRGVHYGHGSGPRKLRRSVLFQRGGLT